MNGSDLSKLGMTGEVKELKFGNSFKGSGKAFHTIRYDFKPASVDTTKMANLEVNNSQVTISMPHSDETGHTVFAGPRKPYGKECVLIIDPVTGECVLEKLTHSIQVKKTRQEKPEGSRKTNGIPPIVPDMKKTPHNSLHRSDLSKASSSSSSTSNHDRKSNNSSSNNSSSSFNISKSSMNTSSSSLPMGRRPQSPMLNALPRHSPHNTSPEKSPPSNNGHASSNAFDALLSNHHSKQSKQHQQHQPPPPPPPQQSSTMPSLTNFDDLLLSTSPINNSTSQLSTSSSSSSSASSFRSGFNNNNSSSSVPVTNNISGVMNKNSPHNIGVPSAELSESSSSSSSSASSSDDDDDDESSDDDDMEVVPEPDNTSSSLPNILGQSHMDKSPSMLSVPMIPTYSSQNPPIRSMPSHLLSEDLQLSESCSDSD